MQVAQGQAIKQALRRGEAALIFAGKSDNDVGADVDVGNTRSDSLDQVLITAGAAMPVHRDEYPVGAGLQRNMQVRAQDADPAQVGQGLDEFVGDGFGFERTQPEPAPASECRKFRHQCGERVAAAGAIGTEVQADQDDFTKTPGPAGRALQQGPAPAAWSTSVCGGY